jgi:hypothetical protein
MEGSREKRKQKERRKKERKNGLLMNFVSLTDISTLESKVPSFVQTSAVFAVTVGSRLYGIKWSEKNFEGD